MSTQFSSFWQLMAHWMASNARRHRYRFANVPTVAFTDTTAWPITKQGCQTGAHVRLNAHWLGPRCVALTHRCHKRILPEVRTSCVNRNFRIPQSRKYPMCVSRSWCMCYWGLARLNDNGIGGYIIWMYTFICLLDGFHTTQGVAPPSMTRVERSYFARKTLREGSGLMSKGALFLWKLSWDL